MPLRCPSLSREASAPLVCSRATPLWTNPDAARGIGASKGSEPSPCRQHYKASSRCLGGKLPHTLPSTPPPEGLRVREGVPSCTSQERLLGEFTPTPPCEPATGVRHVPPGAETDGCCHPAIRRRRTLAGYPCRPAFLGWQRPSRRPRQLGMSARAALGHADTELAPVRQNPLERHPAPPPRPPQP